VLHFRSVVAETAAVQWLERSLDDSAARRVAIPEQLLATDGALRSAIDLVLGLEVDALEVERRLEREAPFLASEAILARAIKKGGDRSSLHERMRTHALASRGDGRDFRDRIARDPAFLVVKDELQELMAPSRHGGRAGAQARAFAEVADAALAPFGFVPPFDDPPEV
jgi:adenylosuccinate lyase